MAEGEQDEDQDIYRLAEDDLAAEARPAPPAVHPASPRPEPSVPESTESEAGEEAVPGQAVQKREIQLESAAIVDCPQCGAPMPGSDEVVCLRCGFDLSGARKIETRTGVEEVEPEIPEEERFPVLTPPGRGGLHLPAIMAGIALLILTIAILAGADGLYATVNGKHIRPGAGPQLDKEVDFTADHPGFGAAFWMLIRFYILTAVFAGSAIGGLFALSKFEQRKIGDPNLAAMRCLAIVCVSELFLLVGFDYGWGLAEWILQFILMAASFILLARLFFRVSNSEAAEFGGVSMLILALFVLIAEVIS